MQAEARVEFEGQAARRPATPARASLADSRRILVVRLGALGDVARTLPAVSALRHAAPEARISWLVEPVAAPLLRHQSEIDEVLVFDRPQWTRALRGLSARRVASLASELVTRLRGHFDLAIDFHSILRSAGLVRLTQARNRVGFAPPAAKEGAHLAYTERLVFGAAGRSRFERNAALVEFLAGRRIDVGDYRIDLPDELRRRAAGACGSEPFAALHPGSSPGASHKQWPESSFAALARSLAREFGLRSLVGFGPSEVERRAALRIVEASEGAAVLAPASIDAAELAAWLASARLFVGADSGPLHIASLVGTPVVQLLGPTHATENEPWPSTPWRRAQRSVPCSPCRRGCGDPVCMSGLAPDAALGAVRELLDEVAA